MLKTREEFERMKEEVMAEPGRWLAKFYLTETQLRNQRLKNKANVFGLLIILVALIVLYVQVKVEHQDCEKKIRHAYIRGSLEGRYVEKVK